MARRIVLLCLVLGCCVSCQRSSVPDVPLSPAPPLLSNVTAIATADSRGYALRGDGTLVSWSFYAEESLGYPTVVDHPVAITGLSSDGTEVRWIDAESRVWGRNGEVPALQGAVQVSASAELQCAVMPDGTVHCAGHPVPCNVDDDYYSTSGQIRDLTNVTRVSVWESYLCAEMSDGRIVCVDQHRGSCTQVELPVRGTLISAQPEHLCVRTHEGTLHCYAAVDYGEFTNLGYSVWDASVLYGDGTDVPDAIQMISDTAVTCAVTSEGAVVCRGSNANGLLGTSDRPFVDWEPLPVGGLPPVTAIAMTSSVSYPADHICALTSDGEVLCWGALSSGESWTRMRGRYSHPRSLGTIEGLERFTITDKLSCGETATGLECWGSVRDWSGGIAFPALPPSARRLVDGPELCVLHDDGSMACWGEDESGWADDEYWLEPLDLELPPFDQVEGWGAHCGVGSDGSVTCWGGDHVTLVGDAPETIEVGDRATDLCVGDFHACALDTSGTVHCWGDDRLGQLGRGGPDPPTAWDPYPMRGDENFAPAAVELPGPATAVECHAGSTCAVVDTALYCWGWGVGGQLGNLSRENRATPVQVAGLGPVVDAAIYNMTTCAVGVDGSVWCWGDANDEMLGDGTRFDRLMPVRVDGIESAVGVSMDFGAACAWSDAGEVWCWGEESPVFPVESFGLPAPVLAPIALDPDAPLGEEWSGPCTATVRDANGNVSSEVQFEYSGTLLTARVETFWDTDYDEDSGEWVTYRYDDDGHLQVEESGRIIGNPPRPRFHADQIRLYDGENPAQPTLAHHSFVPAGTPGVSDTLTYDDSGRLVRREIDRSLQYLVNLVVEYEYDDAGHLVAERYTQDGFTERVIRYELDEFGNRRSASVDRRDDGEIDQTIEYFYDCWPYDRGVQPDTVALEEDTDTDAATDWPEWLVGIWEVDLSSLRPTHESFGRRLEVAFEDLREDAPMFELRADGSAVISAEMRFRFTRDETETGWSVLQQDEDGTLLVRIGIGLREPHDYWMSLQGERIGVEVRDGDNGYTLELVPVPPLSVDPDGAFPDVRDECAGRLDDSGQTALSTCVRGVSTLDELDACGASTSPEPPAPLCFEELTLAVCDNDFRITMAEVGLASPDTYVDRCVEELTQGLCDVPALFECKLPVDTLSELHACEATHCNRDE